MPWPIRSHYGAAIVNLGHQLWHRLPPKVERDLRADVQVDAGDKEISVRACEQCEVPEAQLGATGIPVAKEGVRDHEILRPQLFDESRIGGISESPCDSFSQPRLDPALVAVPVE